LYGFIARADKSIDGLEFANATVPTTEGCGHSEVMAPVVLLATAWLDCAEPFEVVQKVSRLEHPTVLGSGTKLFSDLSTDISLRLLSVKPLSFGSIQNHDAVTRVS
jgi:hypothetical protein